MAAMLTALELELLVAELAKELTGRRLKKVYRIPPETFLLRFHASGEDDRNLLVALTGNPPRINLVASRPPVPRKPDAFVDILRRELKGGRLKDLRTLAGDRVVRLEFVLRGPQGTEARRHVFIELLPSLRNLIVTDEEDIVRLLLREGHGRRTLKQGEEYVRPLLPPQGLRSAEQPFAFLEGGLSDAGLCERLESHACAREMESRLTEIGRRVMSGITRAVKRLKRLLGRLEKELAALPDPDEARRLGDVLKASLGEVPRGAESVELPDWSSGEERMIQVPLDPALGPRENLNRIFKQARKADRARPRLEARLQTCRERLAALEDLAARTRAAEDEDALRAVATEAEKQGLLPAAPAAGAQPPPRAQRGPVKKLPYRSFSSKDGIEILVGRTAADNDVLTFKVARGNDWWFHAANYSGSHVIVRSNKELPQETLLDAAALAAHYSKAPRGGTHDVSWTRRKWVQKFRGAEPGQVQLAQRRTLRIRHDPDRLARLGDRS